MLGLVQVGNARVAHGSQDAAQVRVAGEKGGLHQRRMGNGVGGQGRHSSSVLPPSTCTVMNLVAPSPSRTMAWASRRATSCSGGFQRLGNRRCRPIGDRCIARLVRVATTMKESLVEVSPSIVTRLKEPSASSSTSPCSSSGAMAASVARIAQHGGHVGRIMPAPLLMPVMFTVLPSTVHLAAVGLGLGVGGHDAFGGGQPSGLPGRRQWQRAGRPMMRSDRQRLHDHAGRKRQDLLRRHAQLLGQGGAGGAGARPGHRPRCRHWHCPY